MPRPGLPSPVVEARMAYDPSIDTDDSAIPAAVRRFIRNRFFELCGAALFAVLIALGIALASWSVDDPSLNHPLDRAARNWLGYPGAVAADELMQFFGLAVLPLIAIPMAWAVILLGHRGITRPISSMLVWLGATFCASAALAALPVPGSWALAAGLGGNAGDVLHGLVLVVLSLGIKGMPANALAFAAALPLAIWLGFRAASRRKTSDVS